MNPVIRPMAYRRHRHSACRSSRAERTLRKMMGMGSALKAKPGELEPRRVSKASVSKNISSILPSFGNLSNRVVITVEGPPPSFQH
jgi:hypothetical protein